MVIFSCNVNCDKIDFVSVQSLSSNTLLSKYTEIIPQIFQKINSKTKKIHIFMTFYVYFNGLYIDKIKKIC